MSKWPRIDLTVDTVVFGKDKEGIMWVLLIKRKHDPFKDHWAIPGGFVDEGEDLESAARRELMEETSISIDDLVQFHTFGDPDRDPRKRIVSVAHYGFVNKDDVQPRAADDATEVSWFRIDDLPLLAFDHDKILRMAIQKIG